MEESYFNAKTKEALAHCTPLTYDALPNKFLLPTPDTYANEAVICVSRMPALPEGWKAANRWLELNLTAETLAAIDEWRRNYAASMGVTLSASQTPDGHVTVCFAHCPTADYAKNALRASIPRSGSGFACSYVKALGPPGRENCWVVVIDDEKVHGFLSSARDNAALNTKHALYVPRDGWAATVDEFGGSVIPHITLVRGLSNLDVTKPPPLLNLFGVGVHFTSMTEWVGIESVGTDGKPVKLKFVMEHVPDHS